MPIMGAGVLALLAIIISSSLTSVVPVSEVPITATGGQRIERPEFEYTHFPVPVPVPVRAVSRVEVVPVITAAPVPRPQAEPAPVIQVPSVPATNPAVHACLGKFVGALCAYDEKEGTCITPSWQPLTCVPH